MQTAKYISLGSASDLDIALTHLVPPRTTDPASSGEPLPYSNLNSSLTNNVAHNPRSAHSLGVPTKKPRINWLDAVAVLISWIAASFAFACVANPTLAWRLGVTYQLVVVGFLLSIMNICLDYVAPTLFLQLEARFGASVLQNYEAILRNKPFHSKADVLWTTVLFLLAILPLGLSAAYKLYVGGYSTLEIKTSANLHSDVFGMFAPPGMQPLGQNNGISLMINASTPFIEASTTPEAALLANETYGDPAFDPPLPSFPRAYGFNTLLLNESAAAVLDAPPPSWVNSVRAALVPGESWNISATVTATISVSNDSVDAHRSEYYEKNSTFWDHYGGQGGLKYNILYNGWNVGLLYNFAEETSRDQSWCFLGIFSDPPNLNLTTFAKTARMYNTQRLPCNGTWTITQGGIELVDGACKESSPTDTYERDQLVVQNNQLALTDIFLPILAEFLGPFATIRNQSHWSEPTSATMVASMMWARITSLNGPRGLHQEGFHYKDANGEFQRTNNTGTIYERPATIYSTRPTLKKAPGLFVLFAIQPAVALAVVVAGFLLHSVPVGKGFGLIAMLAGADRRSLKVLEGAALSGKLKQQVSLDVVPEVIGPSQGRVVYSIDPMRRRKRQKVQSGWFYR